MHRAGVWALLWLGACSGSDPATSNLERLPEGEQLEARVTAWVEDKREALGLPEEVALGPATLLGRQAASVQIPLSVAGVPIFGGEVRVHTLGDLVHARSVTVPAGFEGPPAAALGADDAMDFARTHCPEYTPREGGASLHWLATDLLKGRTGPARLAWRIEAEGERGAVACYVDAESGALQLQETLGTTELAYDVWDCRGVSSESLCRKEPDNWVYQNGDWYPDYTPTSEVELAIEYATASCERLLALYGDERACDPVPIYTHMGPGTYAAQQEGSLHFGPNTLALADGLETLSHELAHALHHAHPQFAQALEPGAVNEGLADLNAMLETRPDRWGMRTDVVIHRDLEAPAQTGDPAHYKDRKLLDDPSTAAQHNDWGETHANGVILGHGMWRAVVEGVSVGGKDYGGIGYARAEQIYYEALTAHMGKLTGLKEAGEALVQGCRVLMLIKLELPSATAADHFDVEPVHCGILLNALAEVGLTSPDADLDGWPDDDDTCPDRHNPRQSLSDAPCGSFPTGPGAKLGWPETPPEPFVCPETFLSCDPVTLAPETRVLDAARVETHVDEGEYFATLCYYDRPVQDGKLSRMVRVTWMPFDPAIYEYDPVPRQDRCGADEDEYSNVNEADFFYSSTHYVRVNTDWELPDCTGEAAIKDQLQKFVDLAETLSWPCE